MKKVRLQFIFTLLLSGCSWTSYMDYEPKVLSQAKLGQPYYAEIHLLDKGYTFCTVDFYDFNTQEITELGLTIESLDGNKKYGMEAPEFSHDICHKGFIVRGVPTKTGTFYINASGYEPRTGGELIPIFHHTDLKLQTKLTVVE